MSRYSTKLIADETLVLSIYYLNQKKFLNQNLGFNNTIKWSDRDDNTVAKINISIFTRNNSRFAVLNYSINGREMHQEIYLQSQRCNLKGTRFWFTCPHCYSKIGKLYFSGESFICRRCGDVTYSSRNINRRRNSYIVYNCINMSKKLDELESKIKKKCYRNKPTKIFQKYLNLYNKLHSYDSLLEKANNMPSYFESLVMS